MSKFILLEKANPDGSTLKITSQHFLLFLHKNTLGLGLVRGAFPILLAVFLALSIVTVLWESGAVAFVSILADVLQRYQAGAEWLGRFLSPLVKWLADIILNSLSIPPIPLRSHWTHFFFLMGTLIGANIYSTQRTARALENFGLERKVKMAFLFLIGYLVALTACVAAGLSPETSPYVLPFVFPALGLAVFVFLAAAWDIVFRRHLWGRIRETLLRLFRRQLRIICVAFAVLFIIGVALQPYTAIGLPSILFLIFIFAVCMDYVFNGFIDLANRESSLDAILNGRENLSDIGLYIIRGYILSFFFLVTNAVLALAGVPV